MLSHTAPAKINFNLRVLGRLQNGYHTIDSIFLPLEVADQITIELQHSSKIEVRCLCPEHPELENEQNLAVRAARAYLEASGQTMAVQIGLLKKIWIAAGLGGGSSDGAAVLAALHRHFNALTPAQLGSIATKLGADVSFFLSPVPMRVQGIGETLIPLDGFPQLSIVLLNPKTPLSTAAVYQVYDQLPATLSPPMAIPSHWPEDPRELVHLIFNDLEPAALSLCPTLSTLKTALIEAGALKASMSGSGPTVFGIFADPSDAQSAAQYLAEKTSFSVQATRTAQA